MYRGSLRQHWVIAADPETLLTLPARCACCLAPASTSRREVDAQGKLSVIVPYCDACLRHAARPRLMRLGTMYASTLLAVFCGALLAAVWRNWWQGCLIAIGLSALPCIWSRWLNLPRQLSHAARGQALVLVPHGLACASERYAQLVHRHSGILPTPEVVRSVRFGPLEVVGPLLALVLTPSLNYLFFPVIRVLNLTDHTIVVSVDTERLGSVEPTSGESPAAGEVMRAPSGKHRVRATLSDGTVVSDAHVQIRSGFQHLYAPGAKEGCFYLQRVSYGRSEFDGSNLVPLISAERFWVVPSEVDSWFSHEKSLRRGATSGGVVTLLRMGRCR